VELFDRNHWLVADSNRLLKTEDAGRKWTQTYTVNAATDKANAIQGLSFIDERIGFLIVGGRLLRSDDGGTTWTTVTSISEGEKIQFSSCHFIDAMHGWAVGMLWNEGLVNNPKIARYVGVAFRTQDAGRTWQRSKLDLPKSYRASQTHWSFNDVFFKDSKTGWLVGDRGTIFGTVDGGETWRFAQAPDVDHQHLNFLDDRFGWATYRYGSGSWGIAVSYDAEHKWQLLEESFVYGTWPVFAVFRSSDHGFAVSLKLFETRDRGRKWVPISGDEVAYEYLGQARDGTIVALGLTGGVVKPLLSADMGTTWHTTASQNDSAATTNTNAEELKVYSTVLDAFRNAYGAQRLLILDETTIGMVLPKSTPDDVVQFLQKRLPDGIGPDLADEFRARNEQPVKLPDKFVTTVNYSIVNKHDPRVRSYWEEFHKNNPGAAIVQLSQVAFNKDASQALVYVSSQVGSRSGWAYYIFLTKSAAQEWLIKSKEMAWVS
jgi:photosystem II stability/assembly factor-like uncharacterized protein